ncbi:MAG: hypothetical protein ABIH65_00470 [Nanoarchaeota archaeon]
MTRFLDKILRGEGKTSRINEEEDRYDELIKVEERGDNLYVVNEFDINKGSRILYLNLKTKIIISERKTPLTSR